MNKYQKTAFNNPCFEATECAEPKFKHYEPFNDQIYSVIITANIGLE